MGAPAFRRAATSVLLAVLVLLGWSSTAAAHAGLAGSSPASGAVEATAPRTVRLSFTEPVRAVPTAFGLYDSRGQATVDGAPVDLAVVGLDTIVTVTLPAGLADGSYLLSWRVVSADSHPVSGTLAFAIGAPSPNAPVAPTVDSGPVSTGTGAASTAVLVLGYLGLFAGVGLRAFDLVRGGRAGGDPNGSAARLGLLIAVGAALAQVALAPLRESGGGFTTLLSPAWRSELTGPYALSAALVLAGTALLWWTRPGRLGTALVVAGSLVALSSLLPTGHTRTVRPLALVLGLDLVHGAAAAVWFGGVIGLVLFLRRARRERGDAVAAAQVVARFSALAGVLVALLGVTGLGLGVLVMAAPRDLWATGYGRALLTKLAGTGVVAVLAVVNKVALVRSVQRRPAWGARWGGQWRRLMDAVRDEAVLLLVVLAVTGVLTQLSPTASDAADPARSTVPTDTAVQRAQRADIGSGSLQGRLQPGTAGANSFEFTLRDADGAPWRTAAAPVVSASLADPALGPIPATVTALEGDGHYRADLSLPVAGRWEVLVSVRTSQYDEPTTTLTFTVG